MEISVGAGNSDDKGKKQKLSKNWHNLGHTCANFMEDIWEYEYEYLVTIYPLNFHLKRVA